MSKIKANIITGFLGAGKTTTLINLLKQKTNKEQWAIIINEFGEISIDYITLSEYENKGKLYEVSGGCICCSAKMYFHDHLNKIIESDQYNRILIEPSGLGGPDMVTEIILSHTQIQLMPSICLVDYKGLENKRLQMLPMFRNQIEMADVLVLNKCDLAKDPESISKSLKKLKSEFPGKISYCISSGGNIDPQILDSGIPDLQKNVWSINLRNKNILSKTFTFQANEIFKIDEVLNLFSNNEKILRAKGFLNCDTGWKSFNYTLGNKEVKKANDLPESILTIFVEDDGKEILNNIYSELIDIKA